jgi:hypothetical protein
MDPQVSTSFIPKKQLVGEPRVHASAYGFILLVLVLIFIASIVAAGAAFGYKQFLNASIVSKKHSLELAEQAYQPGVIQDLTRLDSRINQAKLILGKHMAASGVFAFLASQTLERVKFNSFNYQLKEGGGVDLRLDGEADSFSTIALQSDQFGTSKVLKDVIFSNIVVDPATGRVTFSVTTNVDQSFILYSNSVVNLDSQSTDTTSPSTSSSTSSVQNL